MRTRAIAVALLLAVLAGCSTEESTSPGGDSTSASSETPAVEVPDGVTLTEPGSTLQIGQAASIAYRADKNRRSVVTVRVKRVRKGTMKDFEHFSLDRKSRSSTPYYVDVVVHNDGPGGLSRAAVPLFGLDSTHAFFAPTGLVGDFAKCPGGVLPKRFYPGDEASRCLVFMVPKGARLRAVQARTEDLDEPVSWKR